MKRAVFSAVALSIFLLIGVCQAHPSSAKQIYIGFDGAHEPEAVYFHSEQEVLSSWLANNIAPLKLKEILSKVNFQKQVLLLVVIGDRGNVATGKIQTKQVIMHDQVIAYADVGVSAVDCKYAYNNSYPFSLSVVPQLKGSQFLSGFYIQNFSDKCKNTVAQ